VTVNRKVVLKIMKACRSSGGAALARLYLSHRQQACLSGLSQPCIRTSGRPALNQIWVADITYIRLPLALSIWAAIQDVFSRAGSSAGPLSRSLEATLVIDALTMALNARNPHPVGLIHHSDRGVQSRPATTTPIF